MSKPSNNEQLWEDAMRLAKAFVARKRCPERLREDAVQELLAEAVPRAMRKFDPNQSKWSSYVWLWFRADYSRWIKQQDKGCRVPSKPNTKSEAPTIVSFDHIASQRGLDKDPLYCLGFLSYSEEYNNPYHEIEVPEGYEPSEILLDRLQGHTLRELGKEYGLSREKIRLLIKDEVAELKAANCAHT